MIWFFLFTSIGISLMIALLLLRRLLSLAWTDWLTGAVLLAGGMALALKART